VYTRSTDQGTTWDPLTILSTIDNYQAWEPKVAADDSGNVYVCWQDAKYGTIGGFTGTLLLRKSTDNGTIWQQEVQVSPLPSAERSSLSVDGPRVHAVWDDERSSIYDRTMRYRGSADEGLTWCSEETIGDTLDVVTGSAVASRAGVVHTAYSSYKQSGGSANIYYRKGDVFAGLEGNERQKLERFKLLEPYPNPFNAQTIITYALAQRVHIRLSVVDILGREVCVLENKTAESGIHKVSLSAGSLSTGVYYAVLRGGNWKEVKPIVLLK
jgi:hypothetical protein